MDKTDLQSFYTAGMMQNYQIELHRQGPNDCPWMGDFCYDKHVNVSDKKPKGYDNSCQTVNTNF